MPVAFVLAVSSLAYLLMSGNVLYLIPEHLFNGMDIFVLMAIPFFILAGEIMNRSGMSERLITFSNLIIGRVRGGLAQVNVLSSMLFSGITGVALGDVAALGRIFIPNMVKQGYDLGLLLGRSYHSPQQYHCHLLGYHGGIDRGYVRCSNHPRVDDRFSRYGPCQNPI